MIETLPFFNGPRARGRMMAVFSRLGESRSANQGTTLLAYSLS